MADDTAAAGAAEPAEGGAPGRPAAAAAVFDGLAAPEVGLEELELLG